MLTGAFKFITDAAPPLFTRLQGIVFTLLLLYLAAPHEVTAFAEYLQGEIAVFRDFVIKFAGATASSGDNLSAIVTLIILWIGLQIIFILHDTILQLLNSAFPSSSIIIMPSGMLTTELTRAERFTYRFYADLVGETDFSRIFSMSLSTFLLSDEFKKLQDTNRPTDSLTFPRERIIVSLAMFVFSSDRRYGFIFFAMIAILTMQAIYSQTMTTFKTQAMSLMAAQITSLQLIKARLSEKIHPRNEGKEEDQTELQKGIMVGLIVGLIALIYSQGTLQLTVGPWSTKLFEVRKRISNWRSGVQ